MVRAYFIMFMPHKYIHQSIKDTFDNPIMILQKVIIIFPQLTIK